MIAVPRALPLIAALALAGCSPSPTSRAAQAELKAGVLSPVSIAPELALAGTDGRPSRLVTAYRGKVVLLAFGFSNCGEVCPITLATLAGARRKLGAEWRGRAGGVRHGGSRA